MIPKMSTMSDKSRTQVILILGSKTLSGSARQSHILLVCLIFAVEICPTNLEVKSVNPSICAPTICFLRWLWGPPFQTPLPPKLQLNRQRSWEMGEFTGFLSSRRWKVQPNWLNIDCRFLYLFATADLGLIFQRPEYYLVDWGLLD